MARAGAGPSLIVANCYRSVGHFSGDTLKYRSAEEAEAWRARDPVETFADRLIRDGTVSSDEVAAQRDKAGRTVAEALDFAKASPLPDPAEAWLDVYA